MDRRKPTRMGLALGLALMFAGAVQGQNNSLFQAVTPDGRTAPLTIEQGSLIHSPPLQPRMIRQHDIFTVRIDEIARFFSEGTVQRRKRSNYLAALRSFIRLNGLTRVEPAQVAGAEDPTIQGELQHNLQAQSDLESSERLSLNVAVEVVDIRPNGNLVLEGQKVIRVNDEVWVARITGTCRQEDIGIDRTILSDNIADLDVERKLLGSVNDGYRRGWLLKLMDATSPF